NPCEGFVAAPREATTTPSFGREPLDEGWLSGQRAKVASGSVAKLKRPWPQLTMKSHQRIELTMPPSARKAAPFVADESGLATKVTNAAISSGVAKRCSSEVGRAVVKNSFSTAAESTCLVLAKS